MHPTIHTCLLACLPQVLELPPAALMTLAAQSRHLHLLPSAALARMLHALEAFYRPPRGPPAADVGHAAAAAAAAYGPAGLASPEQQQAVGEGSYAHAPEGGSAASAAAAAGAAGAGGSPAAPPASAALVGLLEAVARRALAPQEPPPLRMALPSSAPDAVGGGSGRSTGAALAGILGSGRIRWASVPGQGQGGAEAPAVLLTLADALAGVLASGVPLSQPAAESATRMACCCATRALSGGGATTAAAAAAGAAALLAKLQPRPAAQLRLLHVAAHPQHGSQRLVQQLLEALQHHQRALLLPQPPSRLAVPPMRQPTARLDDVPPSVGQAVGMVAEGRRMRTAPVTAAEGAAAAAATAAAPPAPVRITRLSWILSLARAIVYPSSGAASAAFGSGFIASPAASTAMSEEAALERYYAQAAAEAKAARGPGQLLRLALEADGFGGDGEGGYAAAGDRDDETGMRSALTADPEGSGSDGDLDPEQLHAADDGSGAGTGPAGGRPMTSRPRSLDLERLVAALALSPQPEVQQLLAPPSRLPPHAARLWAVRELLAAAGTGGGASMASSAASSQQGPPHLPTNDAAMSLLDELQVCAPRGSGTVLGSYDLAFPFAVQDHLLACLVAVMHALFHATQCPRG